ncbi:hypothetical protein [Amantichitinum ursilacus]|uniref:Uncharacterized protein n=1 Tax=Amantichitinum ursilacus TaxID=857265 RepID=A0A0N0XJC2_9NEIS|nr:hypothetical protein [Amantichitinum ursilacus]KPC53168.1 hypothetical protein WG78_08760 [Amantichitinum ursilacus]
MSKSSFLADKIAEYDVVMVTTKSSPRAQVLRAKVERTYSALRWIEGLSASDEIEFVHSPGRFGDPILKTGERAIVFIVGISDRLYEESWRGHMLVEKIGTEQYAIYPHRELWLSQDIPQVIRENAIQDPTRPYASAIKLDVMENYLMQLIENFGRNC